MGRLGEDGHKGIDKSVSINESNKKGEKHRNDDQLVKQSLDSDDDVKFGIAKTKYVIFSDIDDTLYTNTFMTKKINHTHDLIQRIENKHVVFISARPEVSLLRYLTRWRLTKDFTDFTLLMGSIVTVCWYIFLYILYLLTFKKISYPLRKAQEYIGTKKIHKFREYLQNNHITLFSKEHMNCIIFMGDNLQGDEYIGEYIVTNMNNYVVYDEIKYPTMCIVLIRDAAKKYTFLPQTNVQFAPLDDSTIFPHQPDNQDQDKNRLEDQDNIHIHTDQNEDSNQGIIRRYNNYKNMFITGLECNILDILIVIKRRINAELDMMTKTNNQNSRSTKEDGKN